MRKEFDRLFNEPAWPAFGWPTFRFGRTAEAVWNPGIDVFERDNRLVTKIDLPGLKKEDIKVEVTDGHLAISGEECRIINLHRNLERYTGATGMTGGHGNRTGRIADRVSIAPPARPTRMIIAASTRSNLLKRFSRSVRRAVLLPT